MQKTFERQGAVNEPLVRHFPKVIGGVCEFHGVLNSNLPSTEQFKLCPNDGVHPVWNEIRCSYCDAARDPVDVLYHAQMNITDSPYDPGKVIAVCNSYTCNEKHRARFQR